MTETCYLDDRFLLIWMHNVISVTKKIVQASNSGTPAKKVSKKVLLKYCYGMYFPIQQRKKWWKAPS